MQNSAWVALLRQIPAEQQARFMLVTASGTEITVQSLLHIGPEFVAVKGRLSGTQEVGRVFFIPYANLDYFGFQQAVKDSEFADLFGQMDVAAEEEPAPAVAPTATAGEPPAFPAPPASGSRPIIRSEVLERFRSRPPSPSSAANLPRPSQL